MGKNDTKAAPGNEAAGNNTEETPVTEQVTVEQFNELKEAFETYTQETAETIKSLKKALENTNEAFADLEKMLKETSEAANKILLEFGNKGEEKIMELVAELKKELSGSGTISSLATEKTVADKPTVTGKVVEVTDDKGNLRKVKLTVPTLNYKGKTYTAAEAEQDEQLLQFLVNETFDRAGNSPFLKEIY